MNFCSPRLFARLAATAALAAWPAAAQQTIQFSKPADPELATKANTFMPSSRSAGSYNAPSSIFNFGQSASSFDMLPGASAARPVSPSEAKRWQQLLDNRKNWTLLTPAEILGVTTPEKILGINDPNSDENLSAQQRFLRRQERLASATATNSYFRHDALARDNQSDALQLGDTKNAYSPPNADMNPGSTKSLKQFLNATPDSLFGPGKKPENPFDFPPPPPKPTPDQLANMDRFRDLMESGPPPDKLTPMPRFAPPVAAAPDPFLEPQPKINPAGHSFAPLESGISRPAGLKPLPGITGPYGTPAGNPSSTAASLPPWLAAPSPFYLPQRKF